MTQLWSSSGGPRVAKLQKGTHIGDARGPLHACKQRYNWQPNDDLRNFWETQQHIEFASFLGGSTVCKIKGGPRWPINNLALMD